ncbi:bifunctional adenosylcobinamide kinase/adenosylcobinamide-phosphate guanylyltransferase [Thalassospiraceae bacterium LMO-JJ14]|nr:bifunctional adenosylcobinamide kinase/adenosylcobinamide-phosphate guanylyltransferase [Thalassospiraceae bacterium LMO-JJ14]
MSGLPPVTLVLGGARSGKSRYAEGLVEAEGGGVYIATAQAWDSEMTVRIEKHRARRGELWETLEAPRDLVGALTSKACRGKAVLVDCLTLWVSNLMMGHHDIERELAMLTAVLPGLDARVVFVSNEVGLGIVPDNAMAREFRDHAGNAHQQIAKIADRVVFVTAGLPMTMKDMTT